MTVYLQEQTGKGEEGGKKIEREERGREGEESEREHLTDFGGRIVARICTRDTEGYQADAAFCGAPRATSVDID